MSQQSLPMTPKLLLMISRHIDNVSLRLASLLVVALDDVDDSIRPPVLALDPVFQIIDGRLKPFDPPVKGGFKRSSQHPLSASLYGWL
jgi:hypothetical protein